MTCPFHLSDCADSSDSRLLWATNLKVAGMWVETHRRRTDLWVNIFLIIYLIKNLTVQKKKKKVQLQKQNYDLAHKTYSEWETIWHHVDCSTFITWTPQWKNEYLQINCLSSSYSLLQAGTPHNTALSLSPDEPDLTVQRCQHVCTNRNVPLSRTEYAKEVWAKPIVGDKTHKCCTRMYWLKMIDSVDQFVLRIYALVLSSPVDTEVLLTNVRTEVLFCFHSRLSKLPALWIIGIKQVFRCSVLFRSEMSKYSSYKDKWNIVLKSRAEVQIWSITGHQSFSWLSV